MDDSKSISLNKSGISQSRPVDHDVARNKIMKVGIRRYRCRNRLLVVSNCDFSSRVAGGGSIGYIQRIKLVIARIQRSRKHRLAVKRLAPVHYSFVLEVVTQELLQFFHQSLLLRLVSFAFNL